LAELLGEPPLTSDADVISIQSTKSASSQPASKKRKTTTSSEQSQITALFASAGTKNAFASLARLFTQNSIARHVAETPEFKEFLRDVGWKAALPTPRSLKDSMPQQSHALRDRLVERLRRSAVTVAVDSWTNVLHQKVNNVVLIAQGVAFYWCSIVNTHEANNAVWIASRLAAVLRTLTNEHHIRIAALVVDNESVNKAVYEIIKQEFPFLVHVPCAAHTVQLAVHSALAQPTFEWTLMQMQALVRFFDVKENRNALKQMQIARGVEQHVVCKPNDTRWSSTFTAAQRLLRIRREVECCFDENTLPAIPSKEAFFKSLADLWAFLQPFKEATDAIQADSATLFTVYTQFAALLQHTRKHNIASTLAVLDRWDKRINVLATVASAILAFATLPPSLASSAKKARDFVRDFGALYLAFYQLCDGKSEQEVRDELTAEWAEFLARRGTFSSLDGDIASITRSRPNAFNPRLVWSLYAESSLATVALVLLSVSASEAAVERTFSAQAAVHTKLRNRLHSATVEAELFLKFNYRTMDVIQARDDTGVIDLDDAFDAEDADVELDCFIRPVVVPDAEPTDNEPPEAEEAKGSDIVMDDVDEAPVDREAAAAAHASASSRRVRREASVIFATLDAFAAWFISEHSITSATKWNADLRNTLLRFSSRVPPPCPSSQRLEEFVRAAAP
jgi:hypothetical protein